MRAWTTLGPLVGAIVLAAGCSLVSGGSPGQLINDTTATTTIKSRLAASEGMGTLTTVHVRTDNDMVHLTGTVKDDAARTRIDRIARNVAGDNRVDNQLQIEDRPSEAKTR